MIRRHPHVFGDETARGAGMAKGMWEKIKAEEKAEKRAARLARGLDPEDNGKGFLDGIPLAFPALTRALKLQEKAARVGFDWGDAIPILDKIEEEIGELREAIAQERRRGGDRRVRRRGLCAGQFRAASEDRSGGGAERHQREIPQPFPLHRAGVDGAGTHAWRGRRWTRWKRSGRRQRPSADRRGRRVSCLPIQGWRGETLPDIVPRLHEITVDWRIAPRPLARGALPACSLELDLKRSGQERRRSRCRSRRRFRCRSMNRWSGCRPRHPNEARRSAWACRLRHPTRSRCRSACQASSPCRDPIQGWRRRSTAR